MKLTSNQTALITGGTKGIGKEIARKLAKNGANIVITGRTIHEETHTFIDNLTSNNIKAAFYQVDASNFYATQDIVQHVIKDFGQIDILVNNAGIALDNILQRLTEEEWDNVINTNLKSVYNNSKAVLPFMLKARRGNIINISSIVGLNGNAGQCNYAAAKAGIIGFSKSLAMEVGSRNIRCNVIAPGYIETDMTKLLPEKVKKQWLDKISLHRFGQAEDVANVALFLVSPLAEYITGQVICCDGGIEI